MRHCFDLHLAASVGTSKCWLTRISAERDTRTFVSGRGAAALLIATNNVRGERAENAKDLAGSVRRSHCARSSGGGAGERSHKLESDRDEHTRGLPRAG